MRKQPSHECITAADGSCTWYVCSRCRPDAAAHRMPCKHSKYCGIPSACPLLPPLAIMPTTCLGLKCQQVCRQAARQRQRAALGGGQARPHLAAVLALHKQRGARYVSVRQRMDLQSLQVALPPALHACIETNQLPRSAQPCPPCKAKPGQCRWQFHAACANPARAPTFCLNGVKTSGRSLRSSLQRSEAHHAWVGTGNPTGRLSRLPESTSFLQQSGWVCSTKQILTAKLASAKATQPKPTAIPT